MTEVFGCLNYSDIAKMDPLQAKQLAEALTSVINLKGNLAGAGEKSALLILRALKARAKSKGVIERGSIN